MGDGSAAPLFPPLAVPMNLRLSKPYTTFRALNIPAIEHAEAEASAIANPHLPMFSTFRFSFLSRPKGHY
jgi:hypothetical protein